MSDVLLVVGLLLLVGAAATVTLGLALLAAGLGSLVLALALSDGAGLPWRS